MKSIMRLMCAVVIIVGASALARAQDERAMPLDRPVEVNGYDLVCTGVGDEARDDPRWREYPVRIEFANRDAQYLADIDVAVADADGKLLFAVLCESPWLLAKLAPGKYTATGVFENNEKVTTFKAPATGQSRVVITFTEVAGDH